MQGWRATRPLLRRYFRRPPIVFQLALLAALLSAAIIVLMAVGSAQVLLGEGSEALPMIYLLLAAVSVPLASGISAALRRWPVAHISGGVALCSVVMALALRTAMALELPGASPAVCIAAYALEIVFDTLFWLFASEHLPTTELKRHTPFLAAAFGLGGTFAGFAASVFCEIFNGKDLLLLDAAFFALCVVQYNRIRRLHALPDDGDTEASEPGILESLKATTRVVRTFPITGATSVSVLLMSALFCLQDYLAMTVVQESFPDADQLSSFMVIVYASHQVAELVVLAVCGRLILEGAGPIVRNLIFPVTTCIGLVALLGFWNLAAAVIVHVNVMALSNAVFEPVKTLNFAALPYRVLAQVRMVIDGAVYPLGLASSALGLIWLQSQSGPRTVLEVSIVVAVAFVGVSTMVGAWFLPNLLRSLRLRAISPSEYVRVESCRMFSARDIRQILNHPDAKARHFGIGLAKELAPELLRAATNRESYSALEEEDLPSRPMPEAGSEAGTPDPTTEDGIRLRKEDFTAVGEKPPLIGLGPPSGRRAARSRRMDAKIWRFAMIGRKPAKRLSEIGHGLENRSLSVRRATANLLARFGADAVPVAASYLRSDRPEVVDAAIRALGGIGTRRAEQLLRDHLRPLYLRAQLNLDALEALHRMPTAPDGASRALEAWLIDGNRCIIRRALAAKSALGNPRDIRLLDSLTRAREPRVRSDAVEALVNLPTKWFIHPLVPLLEAQFDLPRAHHRHANHKETLEGLELTLKKAAADDPWGRLLVMRLTRHDESGEGAPGDQAMLDLVFFLKGTPLFRCVPMEDIARVARLAEPVAVNTGEIIANAGDRVRHVFVIRSGAVEVRLNDTAVEIYGASACIGGSAAFGEDRHLATFCAASYSLLLRFPISIITDLVAENPEVLGPVALDLSTRLNRLRARLAAR